MLLRDLLWGALLLLMLSIFLLSTGIVLSSNGWQPSRTFLRSLQVTILGYYSFVFSILLYFLFR